MLNLVHKLVSCLTTAKTSLFFLCRQAAAAEKLREDYMDDSSIPENPQDMEDEERSLSSQDIDVEESLSVIPKKKPPSAKSSTLSLFSKNLFKKGKGKEIDGHDSHISCFEYVHTVT